MKLLLCTPDHFEVIYAINAYMKVGEVDRAQVQHQWEALKNTYEMIGCEVEVIDGAEGFPDMVFCANQSLPFMKDGKPQAVLSNMFAEQRKGEVPIIQKWLEEHGYETHSLPEDESFESMGDTIYSGDRSFLWGGYGFRTTREVQEHVEEITGMEVKPLMLVNEHCYHLDVSLCVLNEKTAIAHKEAFDEASWQLLQENIEDLIEVNREETLNFACNAHCPDGKNVIIQQGNPEVSDAMRKRGFTVHEIETSEFIKAGGSVFCMKLELPA